MSITTERNVQYVFSVLARANTMARQDGPAPKPVNILDTLHYQHGSLRSWYYLDESTNEVLKRDRKECTKERILEVFGDGVARGCPVAIYFHHCAPGWQESDASRRGQPPAQLPLGAESRRSSTYLAQHKRQEEAQREREDPDPVVTSPSVITANAYCQSFSADAYPIAVDYFDRDKLEGFLETRENKHNVIVQRFVDGGKVNENFSTIEAVWSPYQLFVNQRQAIVSVSQVDVPLQTRCHTFDNDALFNRPLRTTAALKAKIKKECEHIVQQIKLVERKTVIRMVAYFAVTRDNGPVLLWVPELQMMEESLVAGNSNSNSSAAVVVASRTKSAANSKKRKSNATEHTHNDGEDDDDDDQPPFEESAEVKASANKMSLQRQRQLQLISPPIVPSDVRLPPDWQSQLSSTKQRGHHGGGSSAYGSTSADGGKEKGRPASRVTALKGIPRVGRKNIGFEGVAATMASGGPTAGLAKEPEIPTFIASAIAHKRSVDQQLAMLDATFEISKASSTPSCQLDRQRRVASVAYSGGLGSRPQSRNGGELLLLSSPNDRRQQHSLLNGTHHSNNASSSINHTNNNNGRSASPSSALLSGNTTVATVLADPHGNSRARATMNTFAHLPEGTSPAQRRALSPPMPIRVASPYHTDVLGCPVKGAAMRGDATCNTSAATPNINIATNASHHRPHSALALLDYSLPCGFSTKGSSMLIDPFAAEEERAAQRNRARDRSGHSKKFYTAAGTSANQFAHTSANIVGGKRSGSNARVSGTTSVLELSAMAAKGVRPLPARASSAAAGGGVGVGGRITPSSPFFYSSTPAAAATVGGGMGGLSHNPSHSERPSLHTNNANGGGGGDDSDDNEDGSSTNMATARSGDGRERSTDALARARTPLLAAMSNVTAVAITSHDPFWQDKERVFSRGGGGGFFVRKIRSAGGGGVGGGEGPPQAAGRVGGGGQHVTTHGVGDGSINSPTRAAPPSPANIPIPTRGGGGGGGGGGSPAVSPITPSIIGGAVRGGASTLPLQQQQQQKPQPTGSNNSPLSPAVVPKEGGDSLRSPAAASLDAAANAVVHDGRVNAQENTTASPSSPLLVNSQLPIMAAEMQRYCVQKAAALEKRKKKRREEKEKKRKAAAAANTTSNAANEDELNSTFRANDDETDGGDNDAGDASATNINWNLLLEHAIYSRWLRLGTASISPNMSSASCYATAATSSPLLAPSLNNVSSGVVAGQQGGKASDLPSALLNGINTTTIPPSSSFSSVFAVGTTPTDLLNKYVIERMRGTLSNASFSSSSSPSPFAPPNNASGGEGGGGGGTVGFPSNAIALTNINASSSSSSASAAAVGSVLPSQPNLAHLDHPLVQQQCRHVRAALQKAFGARDYSDAALLWDVDLFTEADAMSSNALKAVKALPIVDYEGMDRARLRQQNAALSPSHHHSGGGRGAHGQHHQQRGGGGLRTSNSNNKEGQWESLAAADEETSAFSPADDKDVPPPPPFPSEQLPLLERSFLIAGRFRATLKEKRLPNTIKCLSSMMDTTPPAAAAAAAAAALQSKKGKRASGSIRGGGDNNNSASAVIASSPLANKMNGSASLSSSSDTILQQRYTVNLWDLFNPQISQQGHRDVMAAHQRYLAAIEGLIGRLQRDFYGSAAGGGVGGGGGGGGGGEFTECGNVPIRLPLFNNSKKDDDNEGKKEKEAGDDDAVDDDDDEDAAIALLQFPPMLIPLILEALLNLLPARRALPHAKAFLEPYLNEMRHIMLSAKRSGNGSDPATTTATTATTAAAAAAAPDSDTPSPPAGGGEANSNNNKGLGGPSASPHSASRGKAIATSLLAALSRASSPSPSSSSPSRAHGGGGGVDDSVSLTQGEDDPQQAGHRGGGNGTKKRGNGDEAPLLLASPAAARAAIEHCQSQTEALQQLGLSCIRGLLLVSEEEEEAERERRELIKRQQAKQRRAAAKEGHYQYASSSSQQQQEQHSTSSNPPHPSSGSVNPSGVSVVSICEFTTAGTATTEPKHKEGAAEVVAAGKPFSDVVGPSSPSSPSHHHHDDEDAEALQQRLVPPTEGPLAFKMACLTDHFEKLKSSAASANNTNNRGSMMSIADRRKSSLHSNGGNNHHVVSAAQLYPDVLSIPTTSITFLCANSAALHTTVAALQHLATLIEVSMHACELHSLMDVGDRLAMQANRLEELRKIRKVRLKKAAQDQQRAVAMAALQQQHMLANPHGSLPANPLLKMGNNNAIGNANNALGLRKVSALHRSPSGTRLLSGHAVNDSAAAAVAAVVIPPGYALQNGQLLKHPSATEASVPPLLLFNPRARFAHDWPNAVFSGRCVVTQHLPAIAGGGVVPMVTGGFGTAEGHANNSALTAPPSSPAAASSPTSPPSTTTASLHDGEDDEPHLSAANLQFVALLVHEKIYQRLAELKKSSGAASTAWPPRMVLF